MSLETQQLDQQSPGIYIKDDVYHSLEQFCNSKNLSLAKYKNLLRPSSSANSTSSTPTNLSQPPSPSTSLIFSNSSGQPTELNGSGTFNFASNLKNLRFSLSGSNGSGLNLSSSSLNGKRSSDSEDDGKGNKRVKKSSLNVKLKTGISFNESLNGGTKKVEYKCFNLCSKCIPSTPSTPTSTPNNATADPKCDECKGSGRVFKSRFISVEIPKGTKTGTRKIYKGKGFVGEDLDTYGDLYVEFEVEDHPFYKRSDDNACCIINISVVQAVLGTKLSIPKLYGEENEKLEVQIEPGTQPNELIRIQGEGFQKLNCKKKRGDLEILIKIEVPKHITKEQRELFQKLFLIESMLNFSSLVDTATSNL